MAPTFFGHPPFQPFFLKGIWEKFENVLFPVLDHISKQGLEIDLQDLFQRFTFDITCTIILDHDPKSLCINLPNRPFYVLHDGEDAILNRVGKKKKLREAEKVADDFILDCISRKKEEIHKRSLSARQNKNPRVMYRIREELDMILAQANYVHDCNKDDKTKGHQRYNYLSRNFAELSNKLIYLHRAVCETMRLYPPVAFNNKAPMEPDILPSGHRVDSNMQIILHIYAMERMKSIWGEDCHEFKPERWISNKGSIKHEPLHKFLAFNAGPRM
ncbi:hypothetical protein Cgig2_028306 [Carnegiea gigantea]|uniref:Uncharacterized protein n=1 Tax=Carnegiea gigantea TaxID=171969 RepID=A0A9Q1GLN6_9CARY|nr:hypothetical protein Cgig2_028306 [Carnegiea gigantea]